MRRIIYILLALSLVVGCSGGGGGTGPMTTVEIKVRDNSAIDDIFALYVDGEIIGETALVRDGTTWTVDLGPGEHLIRIEYSEATDNDAQGSYEVTLLSGAEFDDGEKIKEGTIWNLHNYVEFFIIVYE